MIDYSRFAHRIARHLQINYSSSRRTWLPGILPHVASRLRLRIGAWTQKHPVCARYTELSPTGSETSATDRQSEIVAANNGPITHLLYSQRRKNSLMISRARARAYVCQGEAAARRPTLISIQVWSDPASAEMHSAMDWSPGKMMRTHPKPRSSIRVSTEAKEMPW